MLTKPKNTPEADAVSGMHATETLQALSEADVPEKIGLSHSDPNYIGSPHLDVIETTPEAKPLLVKNAVQKHVERLLDVISQSDMATGETLSHAHDAHGAMMKMLCSLETAH